MSHGPCVDAVVGVDLARCLVDGGLVTPDGLQRALARQRAAGGTLDTALLELGLVDEEALVGALAVAAELPPAPPSALADPAPGVRRALPQRLADRHGIAPFRLDGRDLIVLATWPPDLAALDELAAMLGLRVAVHVAPEWRVRELAFRVYGTPPSDRLSKLARAAQARTARAAAAPEGLAGAPPRDGGAAPPAGLTGLAAATTRDEAVRAALLVAGDGLGCAAFVAVTSGRVIGVDAVGAPDLRERARAFAAPLSSAGAVADVAAAAAPRVGGVPATDPLLVALGRREPAFTALHPVAVRGKVVGILYVDADADAEAPRADALAAVAAALGGALERVLLAAKERAGGRGAG